MISPQYPNLPAFSSVATGYGPCRSCLKTFREGSEDRIYITYDPMDGISDLPAPGPIFIHTAECETFSGDGFPAEIRELPMVFEKMDLKGEFVGRETVEAASIETQIGEIFADPAIETVIVRNREAGCYIARVVRRASDI